jgi:hypothetical protein
MQYFVSVIAEGDGLATDAEMAAIDVFNERLQAEGSWVFAAGLGTPDTATVIDNRDGAGMINDGLRAEGSWVFAGGLGSPDTATVIDNRGAGEAIVTDGPFVESKEYLAGFWVIEAPDLDVALKLAAEGSKACNRKVEVRPFR